MEQNNRNVKIWIKSHRMMGDNLECTHFNCVWNDYICTNNKIMRALEFKSRIENNQILIPPTIQSEFKSKKDADVRVIVLIDDDSDVYDDLIFGQTTQSRFLKGYADSDSIYDNL